MGRPLRSVIRWIFEPFLPRSTGFGPVRSPLSRPACSPSQSGPACGTDCVPLATPAVQQERMLGAAARAVLGAAVGDSAPASGPERVSGGVHDDPDLTRGTAYRLTVACAGRGTVDIGFVPASTAARKRVSCDGVPVRERFTPKAAGVRPDVTAEPGATGMIAWRIETMGRSRWSRRRVRARSPAPAPPSPPPAPLSPHRIRTAHEASTGTRSP